MANLTLTDADRGLLAELLRRPATAETLAAGRPESSATVRDRLRLMADNGLVGADEGENGEYELTDSGRRLLRAPSDGSADDAIDLPDDVQETLHARDLDADRFDAVASAYTFLRYWGRATGAEIADGVFAEVPLTHDTAGAWWEFVRDHLAALPGVEPPPEPAERWRFAGRPGFADLSDDGRRMLFGRGDDRAGPYASATEALVDLGVTDRRRVAVGAALGVLQDGGVATREALRRAAREAGRSEERGEDGDGNSAAIPDTWLDRELFDVLGHLPGVVVQRESDDDGGQGDENEQYRYTLGPAGYGEP